MRVFIAYASRHGATREIALRIAEKIRSPGYQIRVQPVTETGEFNDYDAFVIGSALYFGHWLKPAKDFVRQYQDVWASSPVWLFSSGPLGTEVMDAEGRDLLETSEPKELAELMEMTGARSHRVFFGALDPAKLGFKERLIGKLPAVKAQNLLPEGDFRDWEDIDAWAECIARGLVQEPARW